MLSHGVATSPFPCGPFVALFRRAAIAGKCALEGRVPWSSGMVTRFEIVISATFIAIAAESTGLSS